MRENLGERNSPVKTPGTNTLVDTDNQVASGIYAKVIRHFTCWRASDDRVAWEKLGVLTGDMCSDVNRLPGPSAL